MTNLIVSFLGFLTDLVTNYFPAFTLGNGVLSKVVDAFSYFVQMISNIDWLVPVNDVLLIFSLIAGYKVIMFVVFIINWIIRRIGDVIP
jgi:hypothetical protein